MLGRLGLLGASLLVSVLALEAALRLAVPQWAGLVPQRFLTMTDDGVLAGVPHFDGRVASLFGEFDVPIALDARGFRNPPDVEPTAPVAFVGDSFCFGWGVAPEEAFPRLVSRRLGVPAYDYCMVAADLLDDLRIVERWMPRGGRRVTVLEITFENDVLAYPPHAADAGPSEATRGLSRSPVSRWLMTHSALFNVATTLARQSPAIVAAVRRLGLVSGVPTSGAGDADPIAASVDMTRAIARAAGDGPFLVLMVPPRPGQVPLVDYDAFVRALVDAGFQVIDPRAEPGLAITTIPRDGHWDAAMHAAIARIVAARIAPLLPRT